MEIKNISVIIQMFEPSSIIWVKNLTATSVYKVQNASNNFQPYGKKRLNNEKSVRQNTFCNAWIKSAFLNCKETVFLYLVVN